jgi:hypothetical protein
MKNAGVSDHIKPIVLQELSHFFCGRRVSWLEYRQSQRLYPLAMRKDHDPAAGWELTQPGERMLDPLQ